MRGNSWRSTRVVSVLFAMVVGCGGGEPPASPGDTGTETDASMSDTAEDVDPNGGDSDAGGDGTDQLECRTASDCEAAPESSNRRVVCLNGSCVEECEPSYQDNDGDGTCRPTCEEAELDCGEATCSDDGGRASCTCPAGLTFDESEARCVFDGLLESSEFTDDGGWTLEGEASIRVSDGGSLNFSPEAIVAGGRGRQAIELGSWNEIGPLLATVTFEFDSCSWGSDCEFVPPAFLVGGAFHELAVQRTTFDEDRTYTESFCLGPHAYDGAGDFEVVPAKVPTGSSEDADLGEYAPLSVTSIRVRRSKTGICGAPGEVPNGDFELADTPVGWEVEGSQSSGIVRVTQSSRGRVLELGGGLCDYPRIRTRLSVPDDEGETLAFDAKVPSGPSLAVSTAGNRIVETIETTNGWERQEFCLGPGMRGSATQLRFERLTGAGSCSDSAPSVHIDDVSIESNSSCEPEGRIPGGDFESSAGRRFLELDADDDSSNGEEAAIVTEGSGGESNTYGTLSISTNCADPVIRAPFQVPNEAEFENLNALQFRYRRVGTENSSARAATGFSAGSVELGDASSWTNETRCIPPAAADYPTAFQAQLIGSGQSCQADPFDPPEEMHVDDIELVDVDRCRP